MWVKVVNGYGKRPFTCTRSNQRIDQKWTYASVEDAELGIRELHKELRKVSKDYAGYIKQTEAQLEEAKKNTNRGSYSYYSPQAVQENIDDYVAIKEYLTRALASKYTVAEMPAVSFTHKPSARADRSWYNNGEDNDYVHCSCCGWAFPGKMFTIGYHGIRVCLFCLAQLAEDTHAMLTVVKEDFPELEEKYNEERFFKEL